MCVVDAPFVPFLNPGGEGTSLLTPWKLWESKWIDLQHVTREIVLWNRQGGEKVKFRSVSKSIYTRNKMGIFIDLRRP